MATYILLLRYTQQGISKIKESPERSEAAKKMFHLMGGEIKSVYLTAGRYDMVVIAEAPDDETMARICLAAGSLGNVRTETLRAFTEEEYIKIIKSLP